MIRQIHRLRAMTVGELRVEWERLHGEPARSRNRDHLWRRLAWRVQELAHGGLSDAARGRIDELAADGIVCARAPRLATAAAVPTPKQPPRPRRDPRLPTPGTVITRQYHGREVRVVTLDDGFEWNGTHYRSLTAVAKAVTGQKWNGRLFFGLTDRKRRR